MQQEIPAILTRHELSRMLHVSKGTLLKLVHEGKIDAFMIGNSFRFTREAVLDFIENSLYYAQCQIE